MKKHNEIKAGLFLCTGILVFAISIFILGRERQIFASLEPYYAVFSDIKGLSKGAPVRLGGISIGRVDEVQFDSNVDDPKVRVRLMINESFLERLRADSKVTIETQGLLGDRFVSISMGKDKTLAPSGSTLQAVEEGDVAQVMAKAGTVVDNSAEITKKINAVLEGIKPETVQSVSEGAKSLSALIKGIEEGEGFLHKLIYSEKEGTDIIQGIAKATQDISALTNEVKSGKGILHALLYEPVGAQTVASLTEAAKRVSESAAHINDLAEKVKSGDGVVHELVYDSPERSISEILAELSATSTNLKLASEALAKGSGTIGALLVDSQLYDNLVEVTDGAKRSFILRQAIRSSMKEQ